MKIKGVFGWEKRLRIENTLLLLLDNTNTVANIDVVVDINDKNVNALSCCYDFEKDNDTHIWKRNFENLRYRLVNLEKR